MISITLKETKVLKRGTQQLNIGPKYTSLATCKKYVNIQTERLEDRKNKLKIASATFDILGVKISEFKYFGSLITNMDCDQEAVNYNLKRLRAAWGGTAKSLSTDEAEPKAKATIYIAVIQAVLLYGAESCAFTGAMENSYKVFVTNV